MACPIHNGILTSFVKSLMNELYVFLIISVFINYFPIKVTNGFLFAETINEIFGSKS